MRQPFRRQRVSGRPCRSFRRTPSFVGQVGPSSLRSFFASGDSGASRGFHSECHVSLSRVVVRTSFVPTRFPSDPAMMPTLALPYRSRSAVKRSAACSSRSQFRSVRREAFLPSLLCPHRRSSHLESVSFRREAFRDVPFGRCSRQVPFRTGSALPFRLPCPSDEASYTPKFNVADMNIRPPQDIVKLARQMGKTFCRHFLKNAKPSGSLILYGQNRFFAENIISGKRENHPQAVHRLSNYLHVQ
jgi:hypothetical protein